MTGDRTTTWDSATTWDGPTSWDGAAADDVAAWWDAAAERSGAAVADDVTAWWDSTTKRDGAATGDIAAPDDGAATGDIAAVEDGAATEDADSADGADTGDIAAAGDGAAGDGVAADSAVTAADGIEAIKASQVTGVEEASAEALDDGPEESEVPRPTKHAGGGLLVARRWRGRIAQVLRRPTAGGAFARLTVLPAILVMAWFLPGLPLLLARSFVPAAMLLICAALAVALAVNGLRRVPGHWPRELPGPAPRSDHRWAARAGLAGTVVVAAGFVAWQLLANSVSVIVSRSPGAYLQSGYWIAQHGALPIPESLAAFGGAHPGLSFASTGFLPHGSAVVPSSMSGLPMLIAGGYWIHGLSGAGAVSPVLGALAVLSFAGLVGRLAGPQWAPAGALVLAATLPEQYASRSAFSETLTQVLLMGGLCLLIDSLTLDSAGQGAGVAAMPRGWPRWLTPVRVLAALAGLALGLSVLAQADALLYLLPVIPFAGVLIAGRRGPGLPFSMGLIAGVGYGLADLYLESRPYLDILARPLRLAGLIAAALAVLTAAGVLLVRQARVRRLLRRASGTRPVRWLPEVGGVACAAALIGLAVRPYLQTVRGHVSPATAAFIAGLQRLEHLPVDPTRLYAEDTLYWVIWYVGAPAVLLGGLGLALLVRRTLRALLTWQDMSRVARNWGLPLAIIGFGAAAVLWRPGTVPDQPWASRRLVPVVLPGLVLCAIWASAWLTGRARERGAGAAAWSFAGACCVVALLVPTVVTTFGAGLTHSGKNGSLRLAADGLALRRTGEGEMRAVRELCGAIGPESSVLILDRQVAQRFTQVIRGMCGVPAGWMSDPSPADLQGVLSGISAAGRHPVLLAERPAELGSYGLHAQQVLDLKTTQDSHELTQPPTAPGPVTYVIWLAFPDALPAGA